MRPPFTIDEPEPGKRAIVRFAKDVIEPLSDAPRELYDLIGRTDLVVVDLGATETLGTIWIRFLADLTEKAEAATRSLRIAAMRETIVKTADAIGHRESLRLFPTVDEAQA